MVKRMEQAGFVERRRDTLDERVSRVYLTAAGRAILPDVKQILADMEATTFARFTAGELDQLRSFLMQIRDNLQAVLVEERVG
jgi:DNA-binding MarR family transcriptional regulator